MKKKRIDGNPTDQMIQANKDEADGMLSLWGKTPRKHLKRKTKIGK